MPKLKFQGKELIVPYGTEIQALTLKEPSLPLKFCCRQGRCGICVIEVEQGEENLSHASPSERELLAKRGLHKHRLACQCAINGDVAFNLNV